MDRDARRLTRIGRPLVADDPQLGHAFRLWHQRCNGATSSTDDQVPEWVLVVLLTLPAWVVDRHRPGSAALMGIAWLLFALADRTSSAPADGDELERAPHPWGWWV